MATIIKHRRCGKCTWYATVTETGFRNGWTCPQASCGYWNPGTAPDVQIIPPIQRMEPKFELKEFKAESTCEADKLIGTRDPDKYLKEQQDAAWRQMMK